MADLKKVALTDTNDEVISMSFDDNPNIPTANYSEETLNTINEVIRKKMRAERIKKIIEAELKDEKKVDTNDMTFNFGFKSM